MKIYNILLLLCFALLFTSCLTEPSHPINHDFVCSINSDGTGFTKLLDIDDLPFPISYLWDLYVTQDGKLIFAADKYFISDPDSINLVPFSDVLAIEPRRLSLSNDNKAYFCENGILVQYDLLNNTHINLTDSNDGYLMNPMISSDDAIVTLIKKEFDTNGTLTLCYYTLNDDSLHLISQAGTATFNGIYNPLDQRLYHEQQNGLYKIDLNGSNNIHLLTYGFNSENAFGLSYQNEHILSIDLSRILKIYNINSNSIIFQNQVENRLARSCKSVSKVCYVSNGSIFNYDLVNHLNSKITNTSNVEYVICPTWNGNNIYYIANLRINK
jgi:hypothetical protein